MQKQASDKYRTAHPSEDKRPLVLFLFGLLLLLVDMLPQPLHDNNSASSMYYFFPAEENKNWTILRTENSIDTVDQIDKKKFQKVFAPKWELLVPAELSLFINQPMSINTADQETLQMLPGVGPGLAGAIVQARIERGGSFQKTEDLLQVPGIGPKRFAALQALISCQ